MKSLIFLLLLLAIWQVEATVTITQDASPYFTFTFEDGASAGEIDLTVGYEFTGSPVNLMSAHIGG